MSLSSSNLDATSAYWTKFVGFRAVSKTDTAIKFRSESEAPIFDVEFVKVDKVDRAKAFGRIAFACPSESLPGIEKSLRDAGQTILTPLISLDTPGKATVQVVIAADPVSFKD